MLLNTGATLYWLARVMWAFIRLQPAVTITLIACLAFVQIGHVISMFLPLKIIILAASDGIPHVLKAFVGEDQRVGFIIGLSLAAAMFFGLTLALETFARMLSARGSIAVLARTNKMALASREHRQAKQFYAQFCTVSADLAFVLVGGAILTFLNPALTVALSSLLIIEYAVTATLVHYSDPASETSPATWIKNQLSEYLTILATANFFVGFFVLLVQFLTGIADNILLALLSILLMRQILNGLKRAIRQLTKLTVRQHLINPLTFYNHQQALAPEPLDQRSFRDLFDREGRRRLAAENLCTAEAPLRISASHLMPTLNRGIYRFKLFCHLPGETDSTFYHLYVFTPQARSLLEHETYLFDFLKPESLHAAQVKAQGKLGLFDFQFREAATGQAPSPQAWKSELPELLTTHLSVPIPRRLIRAYRSSHQLLHQRLTTEFVARCLVAADSEAEEATLVELMERLPTIQAKLGQQPLIIFSPLVNRENCLRKADGSLQTMTWINWRIEPLGFGIPAHINGLSLRKILRAIRGRGDHFSERLKVSDVYLVQCCQALENLILREAYREVLPLAEKINRLCTKLNKCNR